ncbi:MAG: LPXTG cell wall anchor domain-containing protein [Bacteroidales bacterium]|jgi:LPXTG-motif cell wall-anchored protein|nr:LPXTG cell wall anchor domain-containing protein [Bacteroidales bacterium]
MKLKTQYGFFKSLSPRKSYIISSTTTITDVQYNQMITGFKSATTSGTGTWPDLRVNYNPDKINPELLNILIHIFFGYTGKFTSEKKNVDYNKKKSYFDIDFHLNGGERNWYLNRLNYLKTGGTIEYYSSVDPKIGYNHNQDSIKFAEVLQNDSYNPNSGNSGSTYNEKEDPSSTNTSLKETGDGSNITTYLIIGAVVVVAFLLFKKKKD